MGTPSTPNINQTAKRRVNAVVDSASTRPDEAAVPVDKISFRFDMAILSE